MMNLAGRPSAKGKIAILSLEICFGLLPLAVLILFVVRFAVNVPFWDEWDLIFLFSKYLSGSLEFTDLWQQHNEHRLVFPKVIFLIVGLISSYNVLYEMALSIALAVLIYLVAVFHLVRNKEVLKFGTSSHLLGICLSYFVFSLMQWENWIWGFQLQWFLNIFAVVAGAYIYANHQVTWRSLLGLSSCFIVAVFSLSSGFMLGIIILFYLSIEAWRERGIQKLKFGIAFLLVFVVALITYMIGYHTPSHHPSPLEFLRRPLEFLLYVLVYLGQPLAFKGKFEETIGMSAVMGLLGLCVYGSGFAVTVYRRLPRAMQFFSILGMYSVLCAVVTGVGRLGFGAGQATAARYTSIALLFWIANVFFLFAGYKGSLLPKMKGGVRRSCFLVMLSLIFVLVNLKSASSMEFWRYHKWRLESARDAILGGRNVKCLELAYYDSLKLVGSVVPKFRELGFSLFGGREGELKASSIIASGGRVPSYVWRVGDGWSVRGIYPEAKRPDDLGYDYFFGSWSGSDKNTGRMESEMIRVDRPCVLEVFIIHGGNSTGQLAGLRFGDGGPTQIVADLGFEGRSWHLWKIDLSPYVGQKFCFFAEDNGTGMGQWIGFAGPSIVLKNS